MREVAAVVSPVTPGAFVTAQCGRDPAKAVPPVRERLYASGNDSGKFTELGPGSMQQEATTVLTSVQDTMQSAPNFVFFC